MILGLEVVAGQELEDLVADPHAITRRQSMPGDGYVVQKSAVGAVQVDEHHAVVGGFEPRVLPRDAVVGQFEIAAGVASDQQRAAGDRREPSALAGGIKMNQIAPRRFFVAVDCVERAGR